MIKPKSVSIMFILSVLGITFLCTLLYSLTLLPVNEQSPVQYQMLKEECSNLQIVVAGESRQKSVYAVCYPFLSNKFGEIH